METRSNATVRRTACPAIPCGPCSKTAKALCGPGRRAASTASAIRVSSPSRLEGLGKDLAAGILASRDGMVWVANNGSLDRIKNGSVGSIGKSRGLPGDQVAAMLEDRAGNLWVGVDDGLYLFKDGRFRRLPEPDHQPLGMVVGLTEDVDGNVWAACGRPRKLVRIRDFQVREVFAADQVAQGAHHLAADPRGGIWIATSTGDVVLMRNGTVETTIPLDPRSSPLNRHIVADADGSVLVGSEIGLVGWRAGTIQRMTTKNGLPCDFVIAFVQDTEKHWWLYTRCGVVGFSDAELQKWWANPDAMILTRVYDAFDGAQPNIGSFNAAASTADGRVWFSSGVVVQMLDPSRISQPAGPAAASVESVIVDRANSRPLTTSRLARIRATCRSTTRPRPSRSRRRSRFATSSMATTTVGMRPVRAAGVLHRCATGEYTFQGWRPTRRRLERAPRHTDVLHRSGVYQTTWFRALSATFFVALLYSGFRVRLRALRQRTRELGDGLGARSNLSRRRQKRRRRNARPRTRTTNCAMPRTRSSSS